MDVLLERWAELSAAYDGLPDGLRATIGVLVALAGGIGGAIGGWWVRRLSYAEAARGQIADEILHVQQALYDHAVPPGAWRSYPREDWMLAPFSDRLRAMQAHAGQAGLKRAAGALNAYRASAAGFAKEWVGNGARHDAFWAAYDAALADCETVLDRLGRKRAFLPTLNRIKGLKQPKDPEAAGSASLAESALAPPQRPDWNGYVAAAERAQRAEPSPAGRPGTN